MEFIPGTHTSDQIPHRDTFAKNNLLTRGQEVAVDVDTSKAETIELEPGEMSLHHVRLVHGSAPNPSLDRRIGYAIRHIPTHIRQLEGEDSATLVRGTDCFGHFEPEPRPQTDMDPELEGRSRETVVKILADREPSPPTGTPFELVEFDNLQVTPYVTDKGRMAYSLRATGLKPARQQPQHPAAKDAA